MVYGRNVRDVVDTPCLLAIALKINTMYLKTFIVVGVVLFCIYKLGYRLRLTMFVLCWRSTLITRFRCEDESKLHETAKTLLENHNRYYSMVKTDNRMFKKTGFHLDACTLITDDEYEALKQRPKLVTLRVFEQFDHMNMLQNKINQLPYPNGYLVRLDCELTKTRVDKVVSGSVNDVLRSNIKVMFDPQHEESKSFAINIAKWLAKSQCEPQIISSNRIILNVVNGHDICYCGVVNDTICQNPEPKTIIIYVHMYSEFLLKTPFLEFFSNYQSQSSNSDFRNVCIVCSNQRSEFACVGSNTVRFACFIDRDSSGNILNLKDLKTLDFVVDCVCSTFPLKRYPKGYGTTWEFVDSDSQTIRRVDNCMYVLEYVHNPLPLETYFNTIQDDLYITNPNPNHSFATSWLEEFRIDTTELDLLLESGEIRTTTYA